MGIELLILKTIILIILGTGGLIGLFLAIACILGMPNTKKYDEKNDELFAEWLNEKNKDKSE